MVSVQDTMCWLIPTAIVGLLVILFVYLPGPYARAPASNPCGLVKENRYRVIWAFSSGGVHFREGEILVFEKESAYDAVGAEDPDYDDHDIYVFRSVDSQQEKRIRSAERPDVEEWIRFLQHMPEPNAHDETKPKD
ncbi:MAG: hypothetical protein IIA67_03525 [Planctomycetes bacterium]|nr:hypothetical protein [Planctomycetota bacterium]